MFHLGVEWSPKSETTREMFFICFSFVAVVLNTNYIIDNNLSEK